MTKAGFLFVFITFMKMYDIFFYTYLGFSGLAALISISMWLDYFRKIDVFEPEKLKYLIVALFIGCFTPFVSIAFYRLVDLTGLEMNGDVSNDLFYTIAAIGMNEELSFKTSPFISRPVRS